MNYQDSTTGRNDLRGKFGASVRPTLTVDVKKYQSFLDDPALSDEQREEFLQALWSIVVTFVELGYGVHPLQEACGQDSDGLNQSPKEVFDRVKSNECDEIEKNKESSPVGSLEVE